MKVERVRGIAGGEELLWEKCGIVMEGSYLERKTRPAISHNLNPAQVALSLKFTWPYTSTIEGRQEILGEF